MGYSIMTHPTITIHNLETGEIVTRDLNEAELAAYEITQANSAARAVAIESQATARHEVLERLGITAEEAALLLS